MNLHLLFIWNAKNQKSNQAQSLLKLVVIICQTFFLSTCSFVRPALVPVDRRAHWNWIAEKHTLHVYQFIDQVRFASPIERKFSLSNLIDCNLSLATRESETVSEWGKEKAKEEENEECVRRKNFRFLYSWKSSFIKCHCPICFE